MSFPSISMPRVDGTSDNRYLELSLMMNVMSNKREAWEDRSHRASAPSTRYRHAIMLRSPLSIVAVSGAHAKLITHCRPKRPRVVAIDPIVPVHVPEQNAHRPWHPIEQIDLQDARSEPRGVTVLVLPDNHGR